MEAWLLCAKNGKNVYGYVHYKFENEHQKSLNRIGKEGC